MPAGDSNTSPQRISSTWRSSRLSEDHDHDLIANTVSDGFRPGTAIGNAASSTTPFLSLSTPDEVLELPPVPAISAIGPSKGFGDVNRPSSVSKPPRLHDSLTLRNDGSESPRNGQASSSGSSPSDGHHQPRSQPSHPYQMYPQRTYSSTTSTTEPLTAESSYSGPRAPAHPYAMYTQTTATSDDSTQPAIPIGFNGLGGGYRRQLGPDGEEAGDLIGPLGHTEELPPYSRYPEETYANNHVVGVGTNSADGGRLVAAGSISGAGGIGLATRNPEFSSTEEDLPGVPERSRSLRSVDTNDSRHDINGAARDMAEKPTQNKWQRRARKKLWGVVPYWAICLALTGIIILGIVMGTVIGTIVSKHNRQPPPHSRLSGTSNFELLKAEPSGLEPLPTGIFTLPTMERYQVPKACIADASQKPAWNCDISFSSYSMNVTRRDEANELNKYEMKFAPYDAKASKNVYGSQPPCLPDSQPLSLVTDTDERNRGPAWYLDMTYDKTVVLPQDQLPTPKSNSKRDHDDDDDSKMFSTFNDFRHRKSVPVVGDGQTPWVCIWPNVKVQVFIYANQSSPTAISQTTATTTTSVSSTSASPNPYPKLVKIVERRIPGAGAAPATCTRYKVSDDGQTIDPGPDGKPVTITINETPKSSKRSIDQHMPDFGVQEMPWLQLQKRDVDLPPCGCVSFSWNV